MDGTSEASAQTLSSNQPHLGFSGSPTMGVLMRLIMKEVGKKHGNHKNLFKEVSDKKFL